MHARGMEEVGASVEVGMVVRTGGGDRARFRDGRGGGGNGLVAVVGTRRRRSSCCFCTERWTCVAMSWSRAARNAATVEVVDGRYVCGPSSTV